MKRWSTIIILAIALSLTAGIASAHEGITVGPYTLEVGWVDEPPIVGLKNAVFISIVTTVDEKPVEGVNTLIVTVSMGGQEKKLELRPLGEDTPGQYAADFIPTRRGTYTVKLTGKIESTDVNTNVDIEETLDAASLQFPALDAQASISDLQNKINDLSSQFGSIRGFAVAGLALAVIALVLAGAGLRKKG